MTLPVIVVVCVTFLLALLLAAILPVWCYHRGLKGSSPLPALDRMVDPKKTPVVVDEPGKPDYPCPKCKLSKGWTLSPNRDKWVCENTACGFKIPGPERHIKL